MPRGIAPSAHAPFHVSKREGRGDDSVRIDVGMAFMPMAMIFPAAAASAVVVLMHVIVPARAPFLVVIMPTCAFLIVGMLT